MAKKTKTMKMIEILEEMGCVEVPSRSKYRSFKDPLKENRFYFVGNRGAVRYGRIASDSLSASHIFNKILKSREEKNLDKKSDK